MSNGVQGRDGVRASVSARVKNLSTCLNPLSCFSITHSETGTIQSLINANFVTFLFLHSLAIKGISLP